MVRHLWIVVLVVASGCASAPPPEPIAPVAAEQHYRVATETVTDPAASHDFDEALTRIERRYSTPTAADATKTSLVEVAPGTATVADVHSGAVGEPGR